MKYGYARVSTDGQSIAVSKAEEIPATPQLKALMEFRRGYIAHNLDIPDPPGDGEGSVEKLRYGDETFVLDATVNVADALHHGLNRTVFDRNGSRDMTRRNAAPIAAQC